MYALLLARSVGPPSFLGTSFSTLSGADERAAVGSAAVAAGDKVEVSPQGSDTTPPLFGVPCFGFVKGVPPDLVVAPVEHGNSLIGCTSGSSSEKARRSSLYREGGGGLFHLLQDRL